MAEYQPIVTRFLCKGLNVTAPDDAMPEGKFPILENVRSVTEGTLQPRAGTVVVASTPGQPDVHSVNRLNDGTPFNGGIPSIRVAGAGPALYTGPPTPGTALAPVDSGFSGEPLDLVTASPVGTPQPWLYVANQDRQRKLNVLGQVYETGIAPPLQAPDATLVAPRVTVIENFEYPEGTVPWLAAGPRAGAPTQVSRIDTTIKTIVYDEGTSGNASIVLEKMEHVGVGTLLVLGGAEQTLVQSIKMAIIDTTIEAIAYDDGVGPGLCTIQPVGSLSTAPLVLPANLPTFAPGHPPPFRGGRGLTPTQEWEQRIRDNPEYWTAKAAAEAAAAAVTANPLGVSLARQALPDDGLVLIGPPPGEGSTIFESVRILSVARGPDETQSFRCRTTTVYQAGDSLAGQPTCRVYLQYTHAAGEAVVSKAIQNVLTPLADDVVAKVNVVAGVRSGAPFFTVLPTDPDGGEDGGPTVDYIQTVIDSKAELTAEGASFVGPCGAHLITMRVAQKLAGVGCGLLQKLGGNQCDGKSVAVVLFPNGAGYKVLHDAGSVDFPDVESPNIPAWDFNGMEDPARYIPVGDNPMPPSTPPPDAPFATPTDLDLSKIADRMTMPDDELHLSIKIDKLDFVKEVRVYLDCDATTNDYTRNVFFYPFEANDLMGAIQGFNANPVPPVVEETQTTAVPREPARSPTVATPSTQLTLGNFQWIELRWRVKDMTRIGTDATRSLKHVRGMQVLVSFDAKAGPLTVAYDSAWIGGGFAPDVGAMLPPYTYAARYRSTATGATSRPGPLRRGALLPRRQRVILTCQPSADPQVDTIDYYRVGGTLPAEGSWVGSAPNTSAAFHDDYAEAAILGAPGRSLREFQPWPTAESPRSGRVRVVGSAVQWLSGDPFNPRWPPDQAIEINGILYSLYQQPRSSTFLELNESAGAHDDVPYEIAHPTVLGTPLPTLFGPFEGFYFAVGDAMHPGLLWWTLGNNPDVTSDVNTLYVTTPSTPLMHGFVADNAAFVWSTEDLYRILPDFSSPNMFTTSVLPCGRGLWNRWAWCLTPLGAAFLAKDGIYLTSGGAPAVSLTNGDLYPLFPHDGVAGVPVRGIEPPDMSQMRHLRLAYGDGFLFFDYRTLTGQARTLVCDLKAQRWFLDRYPVAVNLHTAEPGAGVHHVLLGRADGTISEYRHRAGDDATPVPYRFRTPQVDGDKPRTEKLIGDLVLDFDPDGGTGALVTPGLDSFDRTLAPSTAVGATELGRDQYILDINSGTGTYAKNIGLEISGADLAAVPTFYLWEASVIPKGEETSKRATDWEDADYFGAKFMQGVLIEADTEGLPRTIRVEYDGGQLGALLTVTGAPGELQTAHSFQTPFIAHLLRLLPTDDNEWLHYRHRWVWEPSPELAAYWITQPTTHDFPGYGHVERVLIAHMSLVDFDLIVTADGKPETYRIPASANAFVKTEVLQRPNKGKVYSYALRSIDGSERMRIFLKDVEVRAKPWGHPEPYQILRPFGDISREFGGARI